MTVEARDGVDAVAALALALSASAWGVEEDEIVLLARGSRRVSAARRCIWAVLRARGWSLPQIAEATGHHHTSVLQGLRVFDAARDPRERNTASCIAWTAARRLEDEDTPAPAGPAPIRSPVPPAPPPAAPPAWRVRDRSCMSCGRTFRSEGPHNRLCGKCRRGENAPDGSGDYGVDTYPVAGVSL